MTGKIAIVTGGTRGIGLAITRRLIGDGFGVVALYNGNGDTAAQCERDYGVKAIRCDVTDFEVCQSVCADIESKIGPIAVLVNNAGITRDGMLHKMNPENWQAVIDTNLTSCFNMCRAVMTAMRGRSYGRVVNISSINGQKGQLGQTNYAAAKAGMIGFTKALALENAAKGITVNAVCPGYIATDMTTAISPDILESIVRQIPVGRMGTPDEIADAVAFLASDRAAFITGSTVAVNGGQLMT